MAPGSLAFRRAVRAQANANPDDEAAPENVPRQAAPPEKFAIVLLEQWSWGHITAKTLQILAAAAVADGIASGPLPRLAAIGNHGKAPQNCHRDLLKYLENTLQALPKQVHVSIPIANAKFATGITHVLQPYMPVRRMFSYLHSHYPKQLETI